jgi:hypothetical protein
MELVGLLVIQAVSKTPMMMNFHMVKRLVTPALGSLVKLVIEAVTDMHLATSTVSLCVLPSSLVIQSDI